MEDQANTKVTNKMCINNKTEGGDADGEIPLSTLKKSSSHDLLTDLEAQIVRVKHSLQNWREIVLPIHSVLLWEKNWYPGAIIGGTAFFFLSLWILDPSVLTTISILGLTITLSDYLVPIIATTIFRSDSWTEDKEKEYSDFCRAIVVYNAKAALNCASFCIMRTSKPKLFYGCTVVTLLLLAWIGNTFNNLFLTYLLITIVLLTPGLEHHGILNRYGKTLTQKITECGILKTEKAQKQQ